MIISDSKATYKAWLRAAFLYYLQPGENTGMSDAYWDSLGRALYENREQLGKENFPILFSEGWNGGSLFFLNFDDYPEDVKTKPYANS